MASSSTAEVIARLRLSADKFSAESVKAWSDFEARGEKAGSSIKTSIGRALSEVAASAKVALQLPTLDSGQINLNTQAIRNRADAARQEAIVLREVATAAERAATSQDRATDEARAYAVASAQLAQKAEEHASALRREADALDRVQAELGQTARSSAVFATQQKAVNDNARTNQLALRNLGFQVSDVGASIASGGNLFQIFGQQIGQVGGALSDMTGKAGTLGRFLTNPWVAALTTAGIILGTFYTNLEKTTDALDLAKVGSDGLADAQGVLGKMFDLTSGKLKEQNDLLILNARLTALNLRAEAAAERADAAQVAVDAGKPSALTYARAAAGAVLPNGVGNIVAGDYYGAKQRASEAQRYFDAVRNAKTDAERRAASEAALAFSEKASFSGLSVEKKQFQQAIIGLTASRAKDDVAKLIDKSLDDGKLADALRKDGKTPKPKKERDNSKAIAALAEYGRDTIDRISAIESRFAGEPSRVQQVSKAVAELNDIIDDLQRKQPPNFEAMIDSAERARSVVQDSLSKPFRDLVESAREREQIDQLILAGQFDQAEALQRQLALEKQMGPLAEDQKATLLEIVRAEEARARAIEDQRRKIGLVVQSVGEVRGAFEELLSGGGVADFGKNLLKSFKGLQVRIISEQLFGGLEREIEDIITGRSGVKAAGEFLEEETRNSGNALQEFVRSVKDTADRLGSLTIDSSAPVVPGGGSNPLAVASNLLGTERPKLDIDIDDLRAMASIEQGNLNGTLQDLSGAVDDIVVVGKKIAGGGAAKLDPATIFNEIGKGGFGKVLESVIGKSAAGVVAGKLGTGLRGAAIGGIAGSITGGNSTGSQIGGAIGSIAGSFLPIPGGNIIGSIVGGLIGGLFGKTKKASSTLSLADGSVVAGAASGNSASYRSNANKLGGGVSDVLNGIADQLGGDLTGGLSVSIGQRKKKFVVDTTGQGRTKGGGVLSFSDEQAAIEAAVRDALSDGVLNGVSEASKRILASGKDLNKAIQQALLIESVPKELKRRLDPVGFAVDEVNERFERIRKTMKEAGASAKQLAEAQQLYNLELEDAKKSAGGAADSLKEFLASMKAGSSSPLSLYDQERNARAALDPFLAQIGRGEAIDQDKYLSASQTYLDVERQLYGSTDRFFKAFNEIQAATSAAISQIDNAAPIRTAVDSYVQSTAASTANMETLMRQNNALLKILVDTQGGTSEGWLAQARGF